MANQHPQLKNLEKGRKKPKLGKKEVRIQLCDHEKFILEKIACNFNCTHGDKGSLTGLLSQIGKKQLMIVETPHAYKFAHTTSFLEHSLPLDPDETLDQSFLYPHEDIEKKEVRIQLHPDEKTILEQIAQDFGCTHGIKGSLSGLLSKIAKDKLMAVKMPKTHTLAHSENLSHSSSLLPSDSGGTLGPLSSFSEISNQYCGCEYFI